MAAPAASVPSRAASGSQGEAAGAQAAGAGIHGAGLTFDACTECICLMAAFESSINKAVCRKQARVFTGCC